MRKPKSSPLKRVNLQATRTIRARQISPERVLPNDPIRAAHTAAPAVQRRMHMQGRPIYGRIVMHKGGAKRGGMAACAGHICF